ncbi:hypothetical protein TRFO_39019 [Tritrichomonas foetus]|uniref:Uncharacterized protein n=1 Tax=Tritrichomonas foetus TaxID=1144522 RepID=A0A1J4JAX2_9EUKA|nr:hypothetical protein TRFO_39019 [Tritrichomonas foetus]|eukprot:OHS94803.1 hypothetical protein TRFO_39019 [Tritrichomonas foetus]
MTFVMKFFKLEIKCFYNVMHAFKSLYKSKISTIYDKILIFPMQIVVIQNRIYSLFQNAHVIEISIQSQTHSQKFSISQKFYTFMIFSLFCIFLKLAVRGESPKYTIVYSQTESNTAKNASFLLQDYIQKLTDVVLPTQELSNQYKNDFTEIPDQSIFLNYTTPNDHSIIGQSDQIESNDDFILEISNDMLIIHGGERGLHYGVIEIIERFGNVSFFSKDQIFIPEIDEFSVEFEKEIHKPDFIYRASYIRGNDDFNYFLRNNFHYEINQEKGGSFKFGANLFNHTLFELLPPSIYFTDHPGWYAMDEHGRRVNFTQLCFTNQEMIEKLSQNLIDFIETDLKNSNSFYYHQLSSNDFQNEHDHEIINNRYHKNNNNNFHQESHMRESLNVYSVSPNDNFHFCQCEYCRAYQIIRGQNGYLLTFVNSVAQRVKSHFEKQNITNVYIETLITSNGIPTSISPESNVILRFKTIENDIVQSINESSFNTNFYNDLQGWTSKTQNQMIWDYFSSTKEFLGIFPNFNSIQKNLQLYKKNGIIAVFFDGYEPHGFFNEYQNYIISKLLWNVSADVEKLSNKFFDHYYGKASIHIVEFINSLNEYMTQYKNKITPNILITELDDFDNFLILAENILKQAEEEVKNDKLALDHVQKTRASIYYTKFFRIKKERENMQFFWQMENKTNFVEPLNTPNESYYLASNLVSIISPKISQNSDRIINKHYFPMKDFNEDDFIHLSRDEIFEHKQLVEIKSCVFGYNISYLEFEDTKVGIAIDQSGRIGSFYFGEKSFINGNFGGIDFNSIINSTIPIDYISNDQFKIGKINQTYLRLYNNDLTKEYHLINSKQLEVSCSFHGFYRPVVSFSLNIKNPHKLAFKMDDCDWMINKIKIDQISPLFSISGVSLLGRKSIIFASVEEKTGVKVNIPEEKFERLLIKMTPSNDTIRLIFSESSRLQSIEDNHQLQFTLTPMRNIEDIPQDNESIDGYNEDIYLIYDPEVFQIDESLATFVEDSSSSTSRAAHCFCNSTNVAIWHRLQYDTNFDSKYKGVEFNLSIDAKIVPKKRAGNAFNIQIECDNKTIISKDVSVMSIDDVLSPIQINKYNHINIGSFIPTGEQCSAKISCQESAFAVDIGSVNMVHIGHQDEIVDNSALVIGLSAAAGFMVILLLIIFCCYISRKKSTNSTWSYLSADSFLKNETYT